MNVLNLHGVTKKFSEDSVAIRNIDLQVHAGELMALTGESGCGKTTLLRLIAGLEQPDNGLIEIENVPVANDKGFVPPQQRPVGLVFQDYALFPHMTAAQNVRFGLKSWPHQKAKERVKEVLELVNLGSLENRYPHQLSGGQQQRVAIARAMAPRPRLLLLDEPFSNLDTLLKDQVRQELLAILRRIGTTVILVTHDIQDALSMADRIAVLKEGNLLQVGAPMTLYQQPVDAYTAHFFGKVNLIPVSGKLGKVIMDSEALQRKLGGIETGVLCLRPQHLQVVRDQQRKIVAEVVSINFMGGHQQLKVKAWESELWCQTPVELRYEIGQEIYLEVDPDRVHIIETHS